MEDEDEKLVREVFSKVAMPESSTATTSEEPDPTPVVIVKRKADDVQPELHQLLSDSARTLITSKSSTIHVAKKRKPDVKGLGIKLVKKGKVATPVSS